MKIRRYAISEKDSCLYGTIGNELIADVIRAMSKKERLALMKRIIVIQQSLNDKTEVNK